MTVEELNGLEEDEAQVYLENCCASSKWVKKMIASRPFQDRSDVHFQAKEIWSRTNQSDWKEAFKQHLKIEEDPSVEGKSSGVQSWLVELKRAYQEKFGFNFILLSSGKSTDEIEAVLEERLNNQHSHELRVAMKEQQKITKFRLKEVLS